MFSCVIFFLINIVVETTSDNAVKQAVKESSDQSYERQKHFLTNDIPV